jgi:hypothetical protein
LIPAASSERFVAEEGDVIVFSGGEDLVASLEDAYLETLLTLTFPGKKIRFRNLAWEGDTVYDQHRDLNFGTWSNQLHRVGATVVFAQFGQSESLQGKARLPQFMDAYEKLLDEFSRQTQRIVLLSPTPFERTQSPLPDLSVRNGDLQRYIEAIRGLARKRGNLFVDLFVPLRKPTTYEQPLTRDGLHLNACGHWLAARETISQLRLRGPAPGTSIETESGVVSLPKVEQLRQAIREKNRFWFDYWRPMNWAFLHGDRIEQPSSRDHRDPKIRWFPQEMERFMTLIEEKELTIDDLARKIEVDTP